jgi:FkbM family methyltransferase
MVDRPDFYSQNFEDVMLARCFSDRSQGFYIDVGAQHEEVESVTKHFYESGWSGVNIEPVMEFAETFKCRKRDMTVCCAAGAQESSDTLAISLRTGLSTFDRSNAAKANAMGHIEESREIAIRKLDDILLDLGYETLSFEFLKIDVEGFELDVLEGIDLRRYRPEIILCEVTEPNTSQKSRIYAKICEKVEAYNYQPIYFDGLNQWWCTSEKRHIYSPYFRLPPGVFDSTTITPYSGYNCRKQLSHSEEQAKEAQRQLSHSEEQAKEAQRQLAAVAMQMDVAIASRNAIEKEINAIKSSRSWKTTQLLRKLTRIARKALGSD